MKFRENGRENEPDASVWEKIKIGSCKNQYFIERINRDDEVQARSLRMLLFIFGVLALVIGRVLPALSQLARLIEVVRTVANCSSKERKGKRKRERLQRRRFIFSAFLKSKREPLKRENTIFR